MPGLLGLPIPPTLPAARILSAAASACGRAEDALTAASFVVAFSSAALVPAPAPDVDAFSTAAKAVITPLRSTLKMLAIAAATLPPGDLAGWLEGYRLQLETSMLQVCTQAVRLCETQCDLGADPTGALGWHKLCGDFARYAAECCVAPSLQQQVSFLSDGGLSHYSKARSIGHSLPPTHPDVVSLALNMAVYIHTVRGLPDAAVELGEETLEEVRGAGGPVCDRGRALLELLQQNVAQWREEAEARE